MAEPTIWTTVLGAAIPTGLSLLVIVLTRERNSGKDHSQLTQTLQDTAALKKTNIEIQSTLATHTTLHEAIEKDSGKMERRVDRIEEKLNLALGREQGRKHESR